MSDPSVALAAALEGHREKNAYFVARFRVVAIPLWLLSNSLVSAFTTRKETALVMPYVAAYAALSAIAFLVLWRRPELRKRAFVLQWLLDMPAIFVVQWHTVLYADNPFIHVYITAIIYALVLVVGQLTARPLDALVAALTSVGLIFALQLHAGGHPAVASGPAVVLGLIAWVGRYSTRQLLASLEEVTRTEAMRERLSRYLSPSVRDAVMSAGVSSVSARREVTVLMSDLRGFTSLAEKMDSEKLAKELNEYFKDMVEVVFRHKGTLDKFIGDGMLVYFGAPLPNEQHAESAVKCALEMQAALETLNARRAARSDPPLKMGIGINCGAVVVGDLGPPERVEYTIIGDTVNVTARMESLTKRFGVKVLASSEVHRRAAAIASFKPMQPTEVPGKSEPLITFAVEPA